MFAKHSSKINRDLDQDRRPKLRLFSSSGKQDRNNAAVCREVIYFNSLNRSTLVKYMLDTS